MKPTYRFAQVVQLLTSGLSDEEHETLSAIVRTEKKRYSLEELHALQGLIEMVAKNEGMKWKIELLEKKLKDKYP
jgi:hypothetical protein